MDKATVPLKMDTPNSDDDCDAIAADMSIQGQGISAPDVPDKGYVHSVTFRDDAAPSTQNTDQYGDTVLANEDVESFLTSDLCPDKEWRYTISLDEAMKAFAQKKGNELQGIKSELQEDNLQDNNSLSDEDNYASSSNPQESTLICDVFPDLMPDNYKQVDSSVVSRKGKPFHKKAKVPKGSADEKASSYTLAKFLLDRMMFATFYGMLYLYRAPAFRFYDGPKLVAECRKCLGDDVFKSYGWNGITEAFKFLSSDPEVVDISRLSHTSRPLFVFKNGVVSEKPKQIRPATPRDFVFAFCDCEYNPARRKEYQGAMDRYLDFLADGDQELVELVWSVIGAVISQDTTFKKAFVFFGLTQTGKSVLGKLLSMIIGDDYLTSIPIGRFARSFQLSEMQGKLANIVMDDSSDKLQDTSVFKSLTSGGLDSINANVKYGRDIRFRADTIKLVFGFNTLPELNPKEDLEPFFERLVIIPCMNQVPKDKRDEHLIEKLFAEKDYILFRAIKSFFQVKENGNIFPYSEASEKALREYRDQYLCQDLRPISIGKCVREFVDQYCFLDSKTRSHSLRLYEAYCDFAYNHDYPLFDQDKVTRCIKDLFQLEKSKFRLNGPPLHGLIGVGLISDLSDSNDD